MCLLAITGFVLLARCAVKMESVSGTRDRCRFSERVSSPALGRARAGFSSAPARASSFYQDASQAGVILPPGAGGSVPLAWRL